MNQGEGTLDTCVTVDRPGPSWKTGSRINYHQSEDRLLEYIITNLSKSNILCTQNFVWIFAPMLTSFYCLHSDIYDCIYWCLVWYGMVWYGWSSAAMIICIFGFLGFRAKSGVEGRWTDWMAPAVLKIYDTSNNSCDILLHQNSTINDYITCTILTIPPIPLSLWGKFLSVGAIWRRGNIWSWEWADEFHTQMCKWERVRGILLHRSK